MFQKTPLYSQLICLLRCKISSGIGLKKVRMILGDYSSQIYMGVACYDTIAEISPLLLFCTDLTLKNDVRWRGSPTCKANVLT